MEVLTLPVLAVVAGFVSFSSPCCLPLIPGYLSYVSALPVSDLGRAEARRVSLRASLLFVAGFTAVFTLLGVGASALGGVFLRNQNRRPQASFSATTTAQGIVLNGSASLDPEGQPPRYQWYDNGTLVGTGITFTYAAAAGTHSIVLRVLDPADLSDDSDPQEVIT